MERYLNRELTEDESDWFEAYLLDRPRFVSGAVTVEKHLQNIASHDARIRHHRIPLIAGISAIASLSLFWFYFPATTEPMIYSPPVFLLDNSRNEKEGTWRQIAVGQSDEGKCILTIPTSQNQVTVSDGTRTAEIAQEITSDGFRTVFIDASCESVTVSMKDSNGNHVKFPRIKKRAAQ